MLDRELHGRGTVEDAMEVVLDHFALPDPPYFTVGLLVDGLRRRLRLTPKAISDDVRSAKARGLIALSYSHKLPLPVDVQKRLTVARAEARELVPDVIEAGGSPLAVGVGRSL